MEDAERRFSASIGRRFKETIRPVVLLLGPVQRD